MKTTRLLVVLLATMLFYSCKSSEIIQDVWRFRTYNFVHPYSDLQIYDYKGKVKSVKETSYVTKDYRSRITRRIYDIETANRQVSPSRNSSITNKTFNGGLCRH